MPISMHRHKRLKRSPKLRGAGLRRCDREKHWSDFQMREIVMHVLFVLICTVAKLWNRINLSDMQPANTRG